MVAPPEGAGPLVSIIVNNHNYARFVGHALDSALDQTYPRIEIIVVDDGSTDGSREVLEAYSDRCRIIHRENGGQAAAYNSGFAESSGELVLMLDSDDLLAPTAIERAVDSWRPDVAKIQFRLSAVDAEGRPLGYDLPNLPMGNGDAGTLLRHYGYYPAPPGSGNIFARAALQALMPMPEPEWRNGADGYLIGLAPLFGEIVSIHEPLALYRIHGANNSEAGGLSVTKLRRRLRNEIDRERAIKRVADDRGETIATSLSLNIPAHCKARLFSLKLDPAGHPYPEDSRAGLVCSGVSAAWRFPHMRLPKKLAATVGFPLIAIVPRFLFTGDLRYFFLSERRRGLLRGKRRSLAG